MSVGYTSRRFSPPHAPLLAVLLGLLSACAQENKVSRGPMMSARQSVVDGSDAVSPVTQAGVQAASTAANQVTGQVTRQKIQFAGSRGDVVPGYLWVPRGTPGKRYPGIIVMYGITGNKDDGGVAEASQILANSGFVAMTLDWPGTGDRLPPIKKSDRVTDPRVKDWTVDDYGAALNWLSARPEVDPQRLGYAGASMGAMTGLAFAKRDQRIRAVVAMVPIPVPLLWGSDDPSLSIGAVAPRPVLCIMATGDSAGPAVCNNAGPNSEKMTLQDGHELSGSRVQAANAARNFFIRHLGR